MGRQPFGLASPAAWLREAGAEVTLQDLAVSHFDPEPIRPADLIGIYVPMHTATRLAEKVITRIRGLNQDAHVCAYGLYAPMNENRLRDLGADSAIGGEFEQALTDLYRALPERGAAADRQAVPRIVLERQDFKVPDRSGLPSLKSYAHLETAPGRHRVSGYTETTRGCKHLCRHCPIVPVYDGKFVVVQPDVVINDIRAQAAAGAQHITFGDPDFFNGPAHAMRIVRRVHEEFPDMTYDVTIKVEHLVCHADLLPQLAGTGCVLVTSAIESFDPDVLEKLDKRHTRSDVAAALRTLDAVGLALNPTFLPFTPWTTIGGYVDFLRSVHDLDLVDNVQPIQYAVRLLIPAGSRLLELPEMNELAGAFDDEALAHPWAHPDPAVDDLQKAVLHLVEGGGSGGGSRRELFRGVWHLAHHAAGLPAEDPALPDTADPATIPFLTEPWFC